MSDTHSSRRPVREVVGPLRTHPWQDGPAELIAHGLQHLDQNREDFDRRMAFLLFDLGVETLFKTFLLLDKSASGADGSYTARNRAATSESFHEIVEGTHAAAPDRLSADDAKHVLHYHDIRNRLYHRGNGITVPAHHVREYAELAVRLLRDLLAIDLAGFMREPDLKREEQKALAEKKREEQEVLAEKKRQVRAKLKEIDEIVRDIVDLLAPRLLRQRTWQWFDETFRSQLIRPLTPDRLLALFGESGPGTHPISAETDIGATKRGVGELSLSDIDRFFTFVIEDNEVRDYFHILPQEDRRSIISSLFSERNSLLMDMEMDGDNDDDDTYLPYRLSVLLLNNWPGWPYYEQDYRLDLAYFYLNHPDEVHPIYGERGKTDGDHWLTKTETLSLADVRLQQVQPIVDKLKAWLDERTAQMWSEMHR